MRINNLLKNELIKPVMVIVLLFLIGLIITLKNMYYLKKCSKFTIGRLDHTNKRARQAGRDAYYNYKINNVVYTSYSQVEDEEILKTKLLYIRFSCENPELIEGIWDKKVDSLYLKNIPPDGWDKLPK